MGVPSINRRFSGTWIWKCLVLTVSSNGWSIQKFQDAIRSMNETEVSYDRDFLKSWDHFSQRRSTYHSNAPYCIGFINYMEIEWYYKNMNIWLVNISPISVMRNHENRYVYGWEERYDRGVAVEETKKLYFFQIWEPD